MLQRHTEKKIVPIRKQTIINHHQPWSIMVNHGPMSHCDKDCLNMKINHGQPWSTMFILGLIMFILGFIILIPWV